MARVLILLDEGVEESEFIYPYHRFREAGFHVDVCASKAKEAYAGKHGHPFRSDLSPRDVSVVDYEALIIPGGRAPDRMRMDAAIVEMVKDFHKAGKVIAAICHGPQMLIEADIVRGRRMTSWKSVSTDLRNAGAIYVDEEAVVDGRMVTSRSPADLPAFCREALRLLGK